MTEDKLAPFDDYFEEVAWVKYSAKAMEIMAAHCLVNDNGIWLFKWLNEEGKLTGDVLDAGMVSKFCGLMADAMLVELRRRRR